MNLVVVPLVTPAMAAGLVALLAGALVSAGAPSALGAVLAAPGWIALRLTIGIVEVAAGIPFGSIAFEPVVGAALGVASAVLGIAVVLFRRRPRLRRGAVAHLGSTRQARDVSARARRQGTSPSRASRAATLSLVVAVSVAGAVAVSRPAGVARITILDVGQGDAILIEGSRGGRLLIDGGPDPDRLLVELDRRIPPWDRRIDAVVLSHPHEDHVAGLALLLDRYRVDRVLEPGMRGPGPGYAAWLEQLARPGAPARMSIGADDRLTVDEIAMRVLWPVRGQVPEEPPDGGSGINNVSVVLLGVIGERRFLLTGDVEEEVDPSLLTGGLPRVDLLKVAHHGSRTATTDAFVDAVRPRVAVASAGADNPYGHPARPTLERLAASGARVYRTDVDGSVTVTFGAVGTMVRTEPRRAAEVVSRSAKVAQRQATATAAAGGPQRNFFCAIPETRPTAGARILPIAFRGQAGSTTGRTTSHEREVLRRNSASTWGRCRRPGQRPDSATIESMTVPGRVAAAALLSSLDPPAWFLAHARAVAEVAGFLAARVAANGTAVDRAVVEAAALLHDVDKILPADDPVRRLGHGHGSAAWLTRPRSPRARPCGRCPPGDSPRRRRGVPALGGLREPRGADRRVRRQARRPAARVDGGPLRVLAPTLSRRLGRADLASRPGAGGAPRSRGVPSGRHHAGRGPTTAVDRRCVPAPRATDRRLDDHAAAVRLGRRRARRRTPRRPLRDGPGRRAGYGRSSAGTCAAISRPPRPGRRSSTSAWRLRRCSAAARWPSSTNPGALVRRNDTRDRVIEAISMLAAGNALAFVEAAKSGAKGPGSKRLVDAVKAAGGSVAAAMAPRPTSLGAWIETEARDRGLSLAPGAARALADRLGSRVTEGDVERRYLSRIASGELDKLALRHALDGGPVTADDVQALVAEATPGSVWALTDAVGERRVDAALTALDRLIDITPEPVLLAVLHRRVVELLELGDRLAAGTRAARRGPGDGHRERVPGKDPGRAGPPLDDGRARERARGPGRARRDGQGRAGIRGGHGAAPAGVHDVGRRPRCAERQRRAARRPRLTPGPDTAFRPSVGGRPGLFLDDEVALDREDAAAFAEVEQFDQLGIDVELRAVLAQSAGDAEAQPLAPVGQPERRVEPGRDEPVTTGGTAVAEADMPGLCHAPRDPIMTRRYSTYWYGGMPRTCAVRTTRPSRRTLLDPQDRPGFRPVLLEAVVLAFGRREDVDDDRPEVERTQCDAAVPSRPIGRTFSSRSDEMTPSAMASSCRSEPPEQITK